MEDKANKAPKTRVVDSFMTTDENALDANQFSIQGQWVMRVMESTGDCTAVWVCEVDVCPLCEKEFFGED